jgi:RimJ/RimL family protein N-acetyltransferase
MADPSLAPPVAAPLPDVVTDRLDLRRFDLADLDELAELFAHVEVWRYPYGRGFTRGETLAFLDSQIREWSDLGFGCWVARRIDDARIIGYVGLSVPRFLAKILPAVEVGWRFAPSAWGLGYATEGATAALDEAFDTLGLTSVCSLPQDDNAPSARVAERLGMKLLGEVAIPANDRRGELTALHYVIERDAWQSRRG